MASHVSVVIVNWNGCHLLEECFQALAAQTYRDFEVIVVDNGSRDGSVEWLVAHAPEVKLICNQANLGFAAANNQGMRLARASLIAVLNNDAAPEPDWLQMLVQAAEREPGAGMFASQILLREPASTVDSLGIEVDRAGLAWNRGWGLPVTDRVVNVPGEVFGPSGAAALYRRAMLDEIGLFDEELFAYYEDVDLAWRAQWAGWRCQYVPQAVVHHTHSATARRGSSFKRRLLSRNKWWVIAKDYPFAHLWPYVPLMIAIDLVALIVSLVSERNLSALHGRREALRRWRWFRHKRHAILKKPRPELKWRVVLSPVHLRRR